MTAGQQVDIRKHRFGSTDLHVSEFGLGCARIGGIFKRQPSEFIEILSSALDAGINFFDTADIYSQGESETMIGRAFRHRRQEVVIASKAGFVLPSQRRLIARLKPVVRPLIGALRLSRSSLPSAVRGALAQDFSPDHLRKSVEGSLRRLRTDYLDIFQLHSPPLEVAESGEWLGTLQALREQGKIRYFGVSCDVAEGTLAALKHPGLSSIQVPLSLLERAALPALPIAKELGVGVIVRESLANGLLVKELSLEQVRPYCQSDEEAAAKHADVQGYRKAAADCGCSLSQLALQYVNELDGVSVTLIGVSRLDQLQSLLSGGLSCARRTGVGPHVRE